MKTKYSLLLAIPFALAACQSEPEVGDTLYPTEPETYEARVYINETAMPGNTHTTDVMRTPYNVKAEIDTVSFYVRLNKPVATDVTVNVGQVDSLASQYADDATPLPSKFVNQLSSTVTIPAGSMVSSEPIRVALTDLDELEASGVAPLAINVVKGEAKAATDHNVYYMVVNYDETTSNIKSQSVRDLPKTEIDKSTITITVNGNAAPELNDGKRSTYYYSEEPGGYDIVMDLGQQKAISALAFNWGSDYDGYCPASVEILVSNDGTTWQSITDGFLALENIPTSRATLCPFIFYQPITCRYATLRVGDCQYGVEYGDDYNYPCVSEVKLYE